MKIRGIKYLESRLLCLCNFISIKMTVIFLTELRSRSNEVTFKKNGCVKVQKFEDISDVGNNIYRVMP